MKVLISSSLNLLDSRDNEAYDFNLNQFLIRQKHMLHGIESRKLKHLPKVFFIYHMQNDDSNKSVYGLIAMS